MTGKEYQVLAMRTSRKDMRPDDHLLNGVIGLCGESGEVADLIKKYRFQGHAFDPEHLAIELGDILWYIVETADIIGYDLDEIMQMNIDKLKRRYPVSFDSEKSQHREKGDI